MARYQVILAYDGTHFVGFQRQSYAGERMKSATRTVAARTVQGEIETALRQLGWQGSAILAAGRTDSGVHAGGQVIAFDLEWKHSPDELCQAMNAYLPADIAAQTVKVAQPGFHPRYDAVARHYRYHLFCQAQRDPLRERYAWRVWPAVDLNALQEVARLLIGKHDFKAFGAPLKQGSDTLRQVHQAEWQAGEMGLSFDIRANAFLYHMVRRLVFIQAQVGQGRLAVEDVRRGLETGETPLPGMAPANGLVLVEVTYP
jgi:tRNA pseudouridine38-40 synthase